MKELKFAVKKTFPIMITYVFIGIAFGIMMTEIGYSPLWSVLSSIFVYAGSMQIVMVSLLKAGAPLATVAVMTLFVNGRHLFYGLGMIERFREMGKARFYMIFALTDETYSVLCSSYYPEELDRKKVDLFVAAMNQSYWIFGSFLGSIAGDVIPFDFTGIDFAATAFFLTVVVDQLRKMPTKIPTFLGLAVSLILLFTLGPDRFLIPTLTVTTVILVIMRDTIERKAGTEDGK